jgi:beta-N-acetylhexosaminidase
MLDSRSRIEEATAVVEAAKRADVVLLALAVRARSGAGHLAVPAAARAVVEQLPANVKTIAVSFGSPYVIRDLPQVRTYFCAYGIQPVMQSAVVQAMFGEAAVTGHLPVTIPGFYKRGEGIQRSAATSVDSH